MYIRFVTLLALSAAAAMFAVPASALVCYTLLDAKDTVLYRGYEPPVDMSAAGDAAREALRQRKQFLMVAYVDDCLLVATASDAGNYGPATVDEIVSGMRQFASTSSGSAGATPGARSAAPSAGPRSAPAAPAMRSGSTSQRGY